jgi:shikimate kinase
MIENKNLVLIGMPGCGKSTIGHLLSEKLELPFCDIDEYIENKEKKKIKDIFKNGEAIFRKIEKQAVKEVSLKTPMVISTGGGVIKDEENITELKKNGIIIFINRPLGLIISDINTEDRPLLKEQSGALEKLYKERYQLYKMYCDYEIKNISSLEGVVEEVFGLVRKVRNQKVGK